MLKRIFLFLAVNFLVITAVSILLQLLNVSPFLQRHGLDITSLAIFCLIWGVVGAFISLGLSRIMAKFLLGVQVIQPKEATGQAKELLNMIEGLAHKASIPMPEVGVYQSAEVNAFATGPTKSRSLVAVSSGLLEKMSREEIEGVLAHEITHIKNGDMVTMTLLQGIVNAFVMFLARIIAYAVSGLGRNQRGGSFASYYLFTLLFQTIFMFLGWMVIAAYSRRREYKADFGGASLAGKSKMITALQRLKAFTQIQDPKKAHPSVQTFKISQGKGKGLAALFSSHPPLDERIEALEKRA